MGVDAVSSDAANRVSAEKQVRKSEDRKVEDNRAESDDSAKKAKERDDANKSSFSTVA